MALQKCHECAKDVSSEAASCPNCGAKVKAVEVAEDRKPAGWLTYSLLGLAAIIFIPAMINSVNPTQLTPEEQAAMLKQTAADEKNREDESNRRSLAVATAASIKRSLRDPDSLQFDIMRVNGDASVVCAAYRARNGFGGMNREFIVVVKDIASQSAAAWNKHCNTALFDQLYSVK